MTAAEPTRPKPAPGQTLAEALDQCFTAEVTEADFPDRFCRLLAALTTAPAVFVLVADAEGPRVLARTRPGAVEPEALGVATGILDDPDPAQAPARLEGGWLGSGLALPGGRPAAAVLRLPAGGSVAHSLAHERLTLMAALALRQNRHSDLAGLAKVMAAAPGVAVGDEAAMQASADALCLIFLADHAAVGQYDGAGIGRLAISGQRGEARRAALPDRLRSEMRETAARRIVGSERAFAPGPGGEGGTVIHLAEPARNANLLPLVASAIARAGPAPAVRRWSRRGMLRALGVVVLLAGAALVPVPDGIELPATVQAVDRRVITAPFAAALEEVGVEDSATLTQGDPRLVVFDTSETDLDLIAAQAEYAAALLERESARGARDAARLHNAELEAERIRATIDLLEYRKASAEIAAPISGIAIAPDLAARKGSVLRQGEVLFEIADPSRLELELAIPQREIGRIPAEASGIFRPDFDPSFRLPSRVTRISPALAEDYQAAVFLGRARLDGDVSALRPGMKGVLAVERVYRPLGGVVWRNLRNWVLLRVWV